MPKNLHQSLAATLEKELRTLGNRILPSIRKIARKPHSVSKVTATKAVAELKRCGIVICSRGKKCN